MTFYALKHYIKYSTTNINIKSFRTDMRSYACHINTGPKCTKSKTCSMVFNLILWHTITLHYNIKIS